MVTTRVRMADISSLHLHPQAHLVPPMRRDEWQEFYNDIAFRGIKTPLEVLADGTIVDGRHRFRAAQDMGLAQVPVVDAVLGADDSATYMLKAAVLRRHLSDDQRAMMAHLWKQENKQQGARTDLVAKYESTGVQRSQLSGSGVSHDGGQTWHKIADPEMNRPTSAPRRAEVGRDVSPSREQAAEAFKVSRRAIEKATYVATRNPELAQQIHHGEIKLNAAVQLVKGAEEKQKITDTKPPQGQYQVIVIDPPWAYSSRQHDPTHRARNPYESMTVDELAQFNIPAADNCILWMWTTNAFLHEAFHLLKEWGFEYKSCLTWAKEHMGLGDWLRGKTEHCLLAVKGSYRITPGNATTLLQAPNSAHSAKPDDFYDLVERLCPGEKIDIFARRPRDGWAVWGAEVEG